MLGASDRTASHPASAAYTPADLAATILQALGVDLDAEAPRIHIKQMASNPTAVSVRPIAK